ncbi:MAG TPA: efflux RND transporter periplasmic adaptor subunit [Verrucomicrobiales bacterium]|nr:efflux RND transporter periplasmic adaptor subunit [Verrucomicrobiales bacterium]
MSRKKSRKLRNLIVAFVLLALVGGTAATVMLRNKEVLVEVQTGKVGRRDITEVVVANGRVQPVLQVKISPEVSGEIIELPVREAQKVKKGDLLLRIKPDFYVANRNSAEASYKSSLSDKTTSEASLARAEAEFLRNDELFQRGLISESVYTEIKTTHEIAKAGLQSSLHRVDMAKASLARAEEELLKTTILSPLDGTVSQLNSKLGERVVGTAQQAGTDVMTIVDLDEMEARVDIGEMDIVLIELGQKAELEVDAFRDRKFTGTVTEIANAARNAGMGGGQNQDATRFEVKIHIHEKAPFRPGMSVTADVETRYRTNVLAVPIASVTTRPPKPPKEKDALQSTSTNEPVATVASNSHSSASGGDSKAAVPDGASNDGKPAAGNRPVEVVFLVDGEVVRQRHVKLGVSDNGFFEIEEGLAEGQEIVTGGFLAISRELEDGKKIARGGAGSAAKPDKP